MAVSVGLPNGIVTGLPGGVSGLDANSAVPLLQLSTTARNVASGLRIASTYGAQGANVSAYFRFRRQAQVEMRGAGIILVPTFYPLKTTVMADTDFPDAFDFQVSIEPTYLDASSGIPARTIVSPVVSYSPTTGPFSSVSLPFDLGNAIIPKGANYGIHLVVVNRSGNNNFPLSSQQVQSTQGSVYESSLFGTGDFIATGAAANTSTATAGLVNVIGFMPAGILMNVNDGVESEALWGDSEAEGAYDVNGTTSTNGDGRGDQFGHTGFLERMLASSQRRPVANLAKGGDRLVYQVTANAIQRRLALLSKINPSRITVMLGTNDLAGSRTITNLRADTLALVSLLRAAAPSAKIALGTVLPQATTTDSYQSTYNQTVSTPATQRAGVASYRNQYNLDIRRLSPALGHDQYLETCVATENDPVNCDSKWKVINQTTANALTLDGTHPNYYGAPILAAQAYYGGPLPAVRPAVSILGALKGANFNSTSDQPIGIPGGITRYQITSILLTGASISLTAVQGGLYTASGKNGVAILAATQAYTALTGPTKVLEIVPASSDVMTIALLYLSLSTVQGAAATCDVYIYGRDLT